MNSLLTFDIFDIDDFDQVEKNSLSRDRGRLRRVVHSIWIDYLESRKETSEEESVDKIL
jgi:hypothetical protein